MLRTIPAFDRIGEENAFAVLARATQLAAEGRDIINLGIGQPDFRTPDHIVEAAVKALRDGHHGYTPATGILVLREAVAEDPARRFAVAVSPADVMIMPGGKPTMFMSILMFGEPGADILYPDPGISHLPLDDRVHRRAAGAGAGARTQRICLLGRGNLVADHAEDEALDPQLARQPDRRCDTPVRDRQTRRRPRRTSRRGGDVRRDL